MDCILELFIHSYSYRFVPTMFDAVLHKCNVFQLYVRATAWNKGSDLKKTRGHK